MADWNNMIALGLTAVFTLFVISIILGINAKKKKGYTWQPDLDHDVHEAEYNLSGERGTQHRIWLTPKEKPGRGPRRRN